MGLLGMVKWESFCSISKSEQKNLWVHINVEIYKPHEVYLWVWRICNWIYVEYYLCWISMPLKSKQKYKAIGIKPQLITTRIDIKCIFYTSTDAYAYKTEVQA